MPLSCRNFTMPQKSIFHVNKISGHSQPFWQHLTAANTILLCGSLLYLLSSSFIYPCLSSSLSVSIVFPIRNFVFVNLSRNPASKGEAARTSDLTNPKTCAERKQKLQRTEFLKNRITATKQLEKRRHSIKRNQNKKDLNLSSSLYLFWTANCKMRQVQICGAALSSAWSAGSSGPSLSTSSSSWEGWDAPSTLQCTWENTV